MSGDEDVVTGFMAQLVASERGEKAHELPDEPLRLHYPADYVIATWLEHRLHGTLPRAGGYDDQCALLMLDWHALNLRYAAVASAPALRSGSGVAWLFDEDAR